MGEIADMLLDQMLDQMLDEDNEVWFRPQRNVRCKRCGTRCVWTQVEEGKWRLFNCGTIHVCAAKADEFAVTPQEKKQ